MSAPTPARLTRAGVFATVCVGVSLGGHAFASHTPVPMPGAVAGFLLVLGMAWAASTRECGYRTILAWMLWGQLALHVTFDVTQTWLLSGATVPTSPGAAHSTHGPATVPTPGADAGDATVSMVLVHVVAAVLSAWWLRRGEAATFALVGTVRALLVPPLLLLRPRPSPGLATPPVVRPAPVETPPLNDTLLPRVRMLRGPPPLRTHIR